MADILEITDHIGDNLVHALPIILGKIPLEMRGLHWAGFYLEASGQPDDIIAKIGKASENPSPGYAFTWDQLTAYAQATKAIRNGIFIGVETAKDAVLKVPEYDLYTSYAFFVEVYEGQYWRIAAAPDLLEIMADQFDNVKIVTVAA